MNSNYKGKVLFQLCWNQNWLLNVLVLEPGILGSCSRFLKSHDGAGLETQVSLELLSDLTDQTLEGQFADQEFGRFLVTTDLTESDGTGMIPMGFLDSTGGWGRFAGSLGCQLFLGCLASGSFLWTEYWILARPILSTAIALRNLIRKRHINLAEKM